MSVVGELIIKYKICRLCKQNLPMYKYTRDSKRNDGLKTQCQDCQHGVWAKGKAKRGI